MTTRASGTLEERAPARYFPVTPGPFRMAPGFFRLGTDFGNGERDAEVLQRDREFSRYQEAKRRVLAEYPERLALLEEPGTVALRRRASTWIREQLARAGDVVPESSPSGTREDFEELSLALQEDFALLERPEAEADRLIVLSVCFPSGWEPERLLGSSFRTVHAPIPEFGDVARAATKLVDAMVERGPYVRFVWTLVADDRLDHHPTHAPRDAWLGASRGFLRVERQLTIPFREDRGSLFLIRTYVTPLEVLEPTERRALRDAFDGMSESVRRYKGLEGFPASLLR